MTLPKRLVATHSRQPRVTVRLEGERVHGEVRRGCLEPIGALTRLEREGALAMEVWLDRSSTAAAVRRSSGFSALAEVSRPGAEIVAEL